MRDSKYRTANSNDTSTNMTAVTSGTPKWESRACRNASDRNNAATSAVARSKSRSAMRYTSHTEITPAAALSTRAVRITPPSAQPATSMKWPSPRNQPRNRPSLKYGTSESVTAYRNNDGQSKNPGL